MLLTLYSPTRPAMIGEVLDAGFRIFRATLLQSLPYGVLAMIAGKLPHLYAVAVHRPAPRLGVDDPWWWALYAVGVVLAIAFVNAILLKQVAVASGSRLRARAALGLGMRRAPAATAVLALEVLAIGLCLAPLVGITRAYLTWGVVVLAVPASYIGVALSCGWAALLVGNRGVPGSLRYSLQLTRGNWWRTAIIYLIGAAMLAVFYTLAGVIAAVFVAFAGTANIAVMTAVSAEVAAALGAVGVPFYSALALAVYCDLEARRERVDLPVAGAAAG
jgi:hypothetical protein